MTADLLPHTDFDGAFADGTVFLRGEDEWTMERVKWGRLATPTGRLVVCDALGPGRGKPFKRTVEPGKYSVDLAWNGSETCALRVRFSRRKAARWEPALRVGERPPKKDPTFLPCFGVDSGMAGVFDSKAARIAGKDEAWSSRIDGEWNVEVDPKSGAGMIWCFSGYGDGGYPSFWGLDRDGGVACLVLDFLVLVEALYDDHVVTGLLDKVGTDLDDAWFAEAGCTDVRLTWSRKKSELRLEYRRAEPLDITLLNNRGRPVHRGGSGGGGGRRGDPSWSYHFFRQVDLGKQKRAKLVLRRFTGLRASPRR